MQVVGDSNIIGDLFDHSAETFEALIYLQAFNETIWINSNISQTFRPCQVNESKLAHFTWLIFSHLCNFNHDSKYEMGTAESLVDKRLSHSAVVNSLFVSLN